MLPFEFIVLGTPVSHQTKDKKKLRAWKETVRLAATNCWPAGELLVNSPVQVFVVYYYEGEALDVDNMIKPIQDALKGLVYSDDCVVTDDHPSKRDLNGSFRVKGMSKVLADGFCSGVEFVHIKITEAPNQEVLI